MDRIIICKVKSGQTAIQLRQPASVDNSRRRQGLGHRNKGHASLLDAISFYRRHSGPAVRYGNNSAETTVVSDGQSPDID